MGFAGFYTVSVVAIQEGGLHDADLLPLSMKWPKHCRSGLDLTDLATIREQPEPRQQTGGNEHRSSRGFEELDMQMEDRPNTRSDMEDCLQPEHTKISHDTGLGGSGTQSKPRLQVTTIRFQIFIKTPEGKSCLVWVHAESTIMQLKQQIWALMAYPVQIQHLVSGRRSL